MWRRQWQPTPVLLPGKSHGLRSLVGCSPWGREGSDTTERLHFHFPLSCIGEGTGNPLQCSCLENPRDGGAWWAAVCGVAQSWTRLKRLSSSSKLWSTQKQMPSPSKLVHLFHNQLHQGEAVRPGPPHLTVTPIWPRHQLTMVSYRGLVRPVNLTHCWATNVAILVTL